MATTISGTSGVTTPAVVDTGPLSVGPQGITFGDSTVQTTAAVTGATGVPVLNVYSSPGTWTKPATVKAIKVTVVGGGGSGAGGAYASNTTGGSAGGTSINVYPAPSLPGPQPYTVGSGGTGVAASPSAGNPGNTSSFGVAPITVISATGGSGGIVGPSLIGVNGGIGSNGTLNLRGGAVTIVPATGSPSGASSLSGGVSAVNNPGNGTPGIYGSGGGACSSPVANTSGAGGTGVVIVEEFY